MNRIRVVGLFGMGVGIGAACVTPSSESTTSIARTAPPPASLPATTTLTANLHPLARAANDVGRAPASLALSNVSLVMKPTSQQRADRDRLLAAQVDPASPEFHRWLTAPAYAARFGASADEAARMTAWLTSQGLTVSGLTRTGTQLRFSGSVGAIERAFGTELHRYDVQGERHLAMAVAPSIPSAFAGRVQGLAGLHDWRPRAPKHAPRPAFDFDAGAATELFMGPADFAAVYDVAPLHAAGVDGAGETIAVVGQSDLDPNDLAAFRTTFGLPAATPTFVQVPGSSAPVVTADEVQADVDLEWAGAVAPGASLIYVYTGDAPDSNGVVDALAYAIDNEVAPIVSMSFVGCDVLEAADANLDGELAAAANLLGITIVAAAGDEGAAGCAAFGIGGLQVGPPASFPGVVAVGGSVLTDTSDAPPHWGDGGAALDYSGESAWNESAANLGVSGLSATGGGASTIFPKPFWQIGVSPSDVARDVPDVALNASKNRAPMAIQSKGALTTVGGTSGTTPAFAGILALVSHALARNGKGDKLGNANPMLYALAASTPSAFHDITTGDNRAPCLPSDPGCPDAGSYGGYAAGAGYDRATGLGSIDANVLVNAWASLQPTTTTLGVGAASTAEGSPLQLTATVGSASLATAMTGTVSFTFVTYDADGGTDDSWLLGTVNVTPGMTGGHETASAVLSAAIPPGLFGQADVVAMYDGDARYLASRSARSRVSVTGVTFAALPPAPTVHPNATLAFTTTGGTAPVVWQVVRDTTCDAFHRCAAIDVSGVYRAGPVDGVTTLQAIDANGADAFITVTVEGAATDGGADEGGAGDDGGGDGGPPLTDGGGDATVVDSGPPDATPPLEDASPIEGVDATIDGGPDTTGGGASGCGCVAAGTEPSREGGAIAAVVVGIAGIARRRRRA